MTTLADSQLKSHKKLVLVSYFISVIKYSDKRTEKFQVTGHHCGGVRAAGTEATGLIPSIIREHKGVNSCMCTFSLPSQLSYSAVILAWGMVPLTVGRSPQFN